MAVFVAAIFSGYLGEMGVLQTSAEATLEDLTREMARVIKILEPVMQPESIDTSRVAVKGVPAAFYPVVSRGLVKCLPDGNWQFDKIITRGESLFYFASLLEALSREMVLFPVIIGIEPSFVDIGPEHWLRESLTRLAGVGALAEIAGNRLNPDSAMTHRELRKIGAAMIDYLGSNFILIVFDGKVGKIRTKGAMHQIDLKGWFYSFNRQNWYAVDKDGSVIPDFGGANRQNVYFMHDSYMMAGPLEIVEGVTSAGMIKIRRKYSEKIVARPLKAKDDNVDSSENRSARAVLRNRLRQIQQISQKKKNVGQEVEYARVSAPVAVNVPLEPEKPEMPSMPAMSAIPEPETVEVAITRTDSETPVNEIEETAAEPIADVVQEVACPEVKYEGGVVDAVTGKPVKGAVILIASRQYIADDAGKFSFSASPDSVLDLTAYSEGYEALSLRHRAGYRSGPLALSLKPILVALSGRVVHSESGAPLGKVVVKAGVRATRTDSDGQFSFKGLKPGYHQLSCFIRGFMESHEIIHIGREASEPVEVKLRPVFEEYAGAN